MSHQFEVELLRELLVKEMEPRKKLHLHHHNVSDVYTSPSPKKTQVYRRYLPHPPCRRPGRQTHVSHLPTSLINLGHQKKESKNIPCPLDSLSTFSKSSTYSPVQLRPAPNATSSS